MIDGREVDDIADTALIYAEVKALATGNPLILEKAGVDADVARLTRLERSHADEQHRLRRAVETGQRREASLRHKATRLGKAIAQRTDTRGEAFTMTIGEKRFTKRADAGVELARRGVDLLTAASPARPAVATVGILGGLPVEIEGTRAVAPEVIVRIGDGLIEIRWPAADWTAAESGRVVTGLERRIHRLDGDLAAAREAIATTKTEVDRAKARLGQPFEHARELSGARRRQQEIAELLTPAPTNPAPAAESPSQGAPALSR